MAVDMDKLYEAVKNKKIDVNRLSAEQKSALKQHIQSKSAPAKTTLPALDPMGQRVLKGQIVPVKPNPNKQTGSTRSWVQPEDMATPEGRTKVANNPLLLPQQRKEVGLKPYPTSAVSPEFAKKNPALTKIANTLERTSQAASNTLANTKVYGEGGYNPITDTGSKGLNVGSDIAGELLGFAAQGGEAAAGRKLLALGATRIMPKAAMPVASKVATSNFVKGATDGGLYTLGKMRAEEEDQPTATDALINIGAFGAGEALLPIAGKWIGNKYAGIKAGRAAKNAPVEGLESTIAKPVEDVAASLDPAKTIKVPEPEMPKTAYALTDAEKATAKQMTEDEMNSAIEKVQNYIGHNDLRAKYGAMPEEEMWADIAANTGITKVEMERLISNADNYEEWYRMGKAAGAFPETNIPKVEVEPTVPNLDPAKSSNEWRLVGDKWRLVEADPPAPNLDPLKVGAANLPKGTGAMELQLPNTAGQIVSKSEKQPFNIRKSVEKVYNKFSDNLARIDHFKNAVEKLSGTKLSAEDNAYLLAMNTRRSDETAKMILEQGLADARDNTIGQSLKDILSAISGKQYFKIKDVASSKVTSELSAFEDYLLNRHFPSWYKRDKNVFPEDWAYTPEMAAKKIQAYEAQYPEFKQAADSWDKWWADFTKAWLVDTGIMTEKAWIGWRVNHPHYIKLQRKMQDVEKSKWSVGMKAKGSEREIISPIESAIEDVFNIVKMARNNEAKRSIANSIAKNPEELSMWGRIVKENPTDDELAAVASNDVEKMLTGDSSEFFEKARINPKHGNTMIVKMDGKPVIVKIHDKEFLDAISNLTPNAQAAVLKGASQVTRVFKTLTTGANPLFAVSNVARDLPASYILGTTANPVTWARDIVGAFVDIVGNREVYKSFKAMGGTMHSSMISTDRNLLAESKESLLAGHLDPLKPVKTAKRLAGKAYRGLEKGISIAESTPRLAEYRRAVRKGGGTYESKLQGISNAAEVTVNFAKHGNISKEIDSFVPYFNAAIQGLDRLYRGAKENPAQMAGKAFMAITVPTMVLYAKNHNDPNYNNLSAWVKDNYWCIPREDGTFYRIAKPRELGKVFSTLPERLMRQWYEQDPKAFEDFSTSISTTFLPPNPIKSNIASPVINLAMNPDPKTFTGASVVPKYMQSLSPGNQYDEKTSSVARKLGEMSPDKVSPKKVDYLASSYLGGVARIGIPAMSEGSVKDTVGRMFTADPAYSQDKVGKFYEAKSKVDTAYNDAKFKGGQLEGDNEKLRDLYSKVSETISDTNEAMRSIRSDPNIDPETKKKQLRDAQLSMVALAEIAQKPLEEQLQIYNKLKKQGKIKETKPLTPSAKTKSDKKEKDKYEQMRKLLLP